MPVRKKLIMYMLNTEVDYNNNVVLQPDRALTPYAYGLLLSKLYDNNLPALNYDLESLAFESKIVLFDPIYSKYDEHVRYLKFKSTRLGYVLHRLNKRNMQREYVRLCSKA
ncbi:hypothetical protein C8D90_104159 [Enterobacillus tribolii]|uniref:Uncharacterized protein n=1 Tax=Enterobacillus tribolii TaxID=1487935 RepID=A0A370QRX5_9GAMM|nr:hypothetical protein C8D90_104159 [Enterobacillus tribolii]